MRPSSNWRQPSTDTSVDIFGNKKRAGGGDPIRNNSGTIVSNLSQYKTLQQKVSTPPAITTDHFLQQKINTSSAITTDTLCSVMDSSSHIPPHLRSSVRFDPPQHDTKRNAVRQLSNELFRQQLDQQIEEQKQLKHAQRMKEIEQEKLAQEKAQRELEALRLKHSHEITDESGANAGFLRYKNSHSHIPPTAVHQQPNEFNIESVAPVEHPNQNQVEFHFPSTVTQYQPNELQSRLADEVKQTESFHMNVNNNPRAIESVIPNHIKTMEMQLIEEKIAWKQKISEQELELKKLKLQMLQQQNDQKTTLQYLLKLQTDFTDQIYHKNSNNKMIIKRPLSGVPQPVSVQSSVVSMPYALTTPQTTVPQTPQAQQTFHAQQTPQAQQTMQVLHTPQAVQLQQHHPMAYNSHSYHHTPPICEESNVTMSAMTSHHHTPSTVKESTTRMPAMVTMNSSPPIRPMKQSIVQSSYFPMQPKASEEMLPQQLPSEPSVYFKQSTPQISQQMTPTRLIQEAITRKNTPPASVEQKEESFLDEEIPMNNFGVMLHNESSFIVCSASDNDEIDEPLQGSTSFQLCTRPTTAAVADTKESDTEKQDVPCINNDGIGDPFTIHVITDDDHDKHNNNDNDVDSADDNDTDTDNGNDGDDDDDDDDSNKAEDDWKQISDVDRNNVESVRDALQELSCNINNADMISEEAISVPSAHTSMNWKTFVVEYDESKGNEDNEDKTENADEEEEYEQDFEHESAASELPDKENAAGKKRDVLRLPDVDSSLNNFESKLYSVYSSFDNESLLTASVASSSDFSNRSPSKMACEPILE